MSAGIASPRASNCRHPGARYFRDWCLTTIWSDVSLGLGSTVGKSSHGVRAHSLRNIVAEMERQIDGHIPGVQTTGADGRL